jgi:hypothetical protein
MYQKGAAPIRTLLVASLLFMGFIYGMMGWVGSFATVNKVNVSNTITAQYNLITKNVSYPNSGVFNSTKLNTSLNAVTSGLSNPLNIFATTGALGAIGNILLSIPSAMQAFLNILGSPFLLVGVPVTYIWLLGVVIIVGVIALGIISALFIFNI